MDGKTRIEKHPEVDKIVRGLPPSLIESVEDFERQIARGSDLSEYVNTQPFSPKDGVGNRTLIEHYHLRPCKPSCFLVGLVRSINAVYILDVFEHPAKGTFASSEIEERLYSRLADLSPELAEYQLPPIYRSGMPVSTEDRYNPRSVDGRRAVSPVRTTNSDYLPLGQIADLPEEQTKIPVVMASFAVSEEDIPVGVLYCLEYEDHPSRENLTLYRPRLAYRASVYRVETEQSILIVCPLHFIAILATSNETLRFFPLSEQTYRNLVESLKSRFPSIKGKEKELGELVGNLTGRFPLFRA